MTFFEIRQYKILPGKMDEWIDFMQKTILPFQIAQGMVICGSYRGEEDDSVYIWIRRFNSEEEREQLYAAVYKSDHWQNEIADRIGELIDRDAILVTRVNATSASPMQ